MMEYTQDHGNASYHPDTMDVRHLFFVGFRCLVVNFLCSMHGMMTLELAAQHRRGKDLAGSD